MESARALAHVFAANNIRLVYGGGTIGLMGELARTLSSGLATPDHVHGVIPEALLRYEGKFLVTDADEDQDVDGVVTVSTSRNKKAKDVIDESCFMGARLLFQTCIRERR